MTEDMMDEIKDLYDRLGMEDVFHFPSSSMTVKYHSRVREDSRGAIHKELETGLKLDIYALSNVDGIKIAAAFFANMRLKMARALGVRNGALMYILPILHLLIFLLILALGTVYLGFTFGIAVGLIAASSIPLLISWVAASLEKRREQLKENLEMTSQFADSQEIDEIVAWLGTKTHTRGYWLKRILFYEIYYIPITLILVFLLTL